MQAVIQAWMGPKLQLIPGRLRGATRRQVHAGCAAAMTQGHIAEQVFHVGQGFGALHPAVVQLLALRSHRGLRPGVVPQPPQLSSRSGRPRCRPEPRKGNLGAWEGWRLRLLHGSQCGWMSDKVAPIGRKMRCTQIRLAMADHQEHLHAFTGSRPGTGKLT